MPDWLQLVREKVGPLQLDTKRKEEIATELADHLSDIYEAFRRNGLPEEDAIERALAEVGEWNLLCCGIQQVEQEEGTMHRVKCFWLPGLVATGAFVAWFFLTSKVALLVFTKHKFGAPPVPLYVWIVFLAWWAFALMGLGAAVASWSGRVGGRLRHQILAACFPAVFVEVLLAVLSVDLLLRKNSLPQWSHVSAGFLLLSILVAGVVPVGLPLLLGAALELVAKRRHRALSFQMGQRTPSQ